MLDLDEIRAEIATFKKRYGLQDEDEHVIAAIHLINAHKIHPSLAQDQTSHGGGDNGIDGWYYDDKVGSLHVYQSKLTGSKGCAAQGFKDLLRAGNWIDGILESGEIGTGPANPALYNLAGCLDRNKEKLSHVYFHLISPFVRNELIGQPEYEDASDELSKSCLNKWVLARDGQLHLQPEMYYLEGGVPDAPPQYEVTGRSAKVRQGWTTNRA